jgi:hypothetical protein
VHKGCEQRAGDRLSCRIEALLFRAERGDFPSSQIIAGKLRELRLNRAAFRDACNRIQPWRGVEHAGLYAGAGKLRGEIGEAH